PSRFRADHAGLDQDGSLDDHLWFQHPAILSHTRRCHSARAPDRSDGGRNNDDGHRTRRSLAGDVRAPSGAAGLESSVSALSWLSTPSAFSSAVPGRAGRCARDAGFVRHAVSPLKPLKLGAEHLPGTESGESHPASANLTLTVWTPGGSRSM